MGLSEPPELVAFDAARALDAGREVAGGDLLTCVEYTHQSFHPIYVSDRVHDLYDDDQHMDDHFADVMAYCFIDFSERLLFEDELPPAGRVQYFLTRLEHATVVRLLTDAEGLFVTLAPGTPVIDTVDAMREAILDTGPATDTPYST